jgi:hypothetical protein
VQFYYDDKMPLRILDEGEFWKQQESEHTVVIRELVKDLEPDYVEALKSWEQAFAQTEAVFRRYIETVIRSGRKLRSRVLTQIKDLVAFSGYQSKQFILLLNELGMESSALKDNPTAIVVLNHIRRESEYFIGISEALLSKNMLRM